MRIKRISSKVFLVMICLLLVAMPNMNNSNIKMANALSEQSFADSGLNYVESLEDIANPERGFYKPTTVTLTPEGGSGAPSVNTLKNRISEQQVSSNARTFVNISHFLISLNAFSSNAYTASGNVSTAPKGTTAPLTEQTLDYFRGALQNVREAGANVLLRFSYNIQGWGINHSTNLLQAGDKIPGTAGGPNYLEAEPELDVILNHIDQLKPVFMEYEDVIMTVETGFVGPWGEMHSTQMAKRPQDVVQIMNALLDALPESRTILVRNPSLYLAWFNNEFDAEAVAQHNPTDGYTPYIVNGKYAFGDFAGHINIKDLPPQEGSRAARIGMYNDAYLSNSGDMGTFADNTNYAETRYPRGLAIENWLELYTHFYGGEAIKDTSSGLNFSSIEYAAWEAFKTQTSHLNFDYDRKTFNAWTEVPYAVGKLGGLSGLFSGGNNQSAVLDERYAEANATAFEYFRNHMGYRLVIRDLQIKQPQSVGGTLSIKGKMENVGFGSIVNQKKAALILVNTETKQSYTKLLNISPNEWKASTGKVDFAFDVEMKNGANPLASGIYELYLKVYDAADDETAVLRTIRFANDDINLWNETLGANRIGAVAHSNDSVLATFKNYDGSILDYSLVKPSQNAVYNAEKPTNPTVEGVATYEFTGWDKSLENVTSATIFTAQYERTMPKYEIAFYTDEEDLIAKIEITHGEKITQSDMENVSLTYESGDYICTIIGWTKNLDTGMPFNIFAGNVTENMSLFALVEVSVKPKASFMVTFDGNGGTLQSGEAVQEVEEGGSATPPVFVKDGYVFDGWSSEAYNNVSTDVTITAKWKLAESETKKGCGSNVDLNYNPLIFVIAILALVSLMALTKRKKKQG